MSFGRKHIRLCVLGLVIWAGLMAGCSKKIAITQYPEFWTEDLKVIAVVPFRNTSGVNNAGETVSELLARALAGNGTYTVYNRSDLKTLLDEQDLRLALSGDSSQSTKALGKSGKVQGILTGTVTNYAATSRNEPKHDPIYAYDRKGNQYVSGYRDWVQTHNQATVVVTAALLRPDGTTIHSTAPVQKAASSTSSEYGPPSMDPQMCLVAACQEAVNQLVEDFAVVRKTISVDPAQAFRTASDFYDNKYAFTDTFKCSDKKMLAVVSLPACCDRNRFRITVVKANERADLAEVDIVWKHEWKTQSFVLNPSEIGQKGGGPGEYWVKFYSGPEPIFVNKVYLK
jgi:hypothetical protein